MDHFFKHQKRMQKEVGNFLFISLCTHLSRTLHTTMGNKLRDMRFRPHAGPQNRKQTWKQAGQHSTAHKVRAILEVRTPKVCSYLGKSGNQDETGWDWESLKKTRFGCWILLNFAELRFQGAVRNSMAWQAMFRSTSTSRRPDEICPNFPKWLFQCRLPIPS